MSRESQIFCIYCQEEFTTNRKLVAHIATEHKDTYAYHAFIKDSDPTTEEQ